MRRALELAARGRGRVHPNPMVGAVVVKGGRVIAEGWHERFGGPHAEAMAIGRLKKIPAGAKLYVTLEPCGHTGKKTPPCAGLILKSGIRNVVVAARDPNPLVNGRGIRRLRRAGVKVTEGVLEREARELNRDFEYWVRHRRPYVTAKIAQSLDGRLIARPGERWVTGRDARRLAHRMRAASDAILVGVKTVIRDNPLLSVRLPGTKLAPLKVVLDSRLRTPPRARIFGKASPGPVLLAVTSKAPRAARRRFGGRAEVLEVRQKGGRVDLAALLEELAGRGVVHVLIEGGAEVMSDALSRGLVQEVCFFIAPRLIGGEAPRVHFLKETLNVKDPRIISAGKDWLVRGRL
ncbi:MAG: riboflavin biosynthesis protein RibD [Omnitrophica WOR_2 bacterium RIFCSPHIGHO2_02_FULL_68_15]|nr:MAG: riboflavin biosynthesis protein RibD [Omnitrophica WOR_2 bacterium RIFCSPHIGHO2_02_FULL_68_15]